MDRWNQEHLVINEESGSRRLEVELQCVRIGECVLITPPAELLVEAGLRIKRASPYKYTFVLGLTNAYIHYGPPAEAYERGGYEVTECPLAPEWEEIYEKKALEIISRL